MTDETPDLGRLPTLRKRLAELRSGIVRQILAYGAGTVLGAASLWLCFAFLADWGLRVPHGLRVFHGFVLLFVIALFAWRDLFRPLARIPGPEGLTLLFERAHPELRELLISAVQFQRAPAAGDPELVAGVVARAEARAAELHPRAVIDPEAPRARFLLGIGATLSLALLAWQNPLHARIFLERLLGSTVAWPQRTHLTLDLPGLSADSLVERSEALWRLRLARGTDLAVLVTAEGQVPDEVTVHFDGGRDQVLNPSGENVFRTLLRSCQEDLSFHVTGGDDVDELPRVEIEILEPPDVAGIAIAVRPPAYSTLPETLVFNQDVDVLRGSELTVHVLPEPADAVGLVRLLPDDVTRSLTPAPFPSENGGEPVPGVSFALTADKTIGFRIELTDRNGLTNPEPGLFRVRVLEDRPPELSVLAPLARRVRDRARRRAAAARSRRGRLRPGGAGLARDERRRGRRARRERRAHAPAAPDAGDGSARSGAGLRAARGAVARHGRGARGRRRALRARVLRARPARTGGERGPLAADPRARRHARGAPAPPAGPPGAGAHGRRAALRGAARQARAHRRAAGRARERRDARFR
jgi:hypothetical protein